MRGPAGIGKSRLVAELLEALGPDPGGPRAVPCRTDSPRPARSADVLRAVGADRRRRRPGDHRGRIAEVLRGDARAATLAPHLAPTAGPHRGPRRGRRRPRPPWPGCGRRCGAEQPVVVALEDAHRPRAGRLDLMLRSLPESRPNGVVLVAVLARSDETEALPLAWPRPADVVVDLGPLGDAAAEQLAADLLAGDELGAAGAPSALLARASGNPLFLRELVRTSRERPGDPPAAAVPPTVEALLSSRLEPASHRSPGSSPSARRSSARASPTAPGGLSSVRAAARGRGPGAAPAPGARAPRRPGALPGEGCASAHALYAESAYRGLLRAPGLELHQALADWLETAAADRLAGHRERLGHHLERAVLNRRALGRHGAETDRTAMRGARWLGDAGRRALARDDAPAAADLLAAP